MWPPTRSVLRDYVVKLRDDDALGLAAELAYRFLFALFPFGIFVAAFLAYGSQWLGVESAPRQIVDGLVDNLPPDLARAVRPELERVIGEAHPGLLSIGALGALWSATGATLALVKAMNRAYDVEDERPFLRRYATALVLTLLATLGIVVSFVSIVGGTVVTEELAQRFGWGQTAWAVANVARWPAAFALLTVSVGVLLRLAPNVAAPWRLTLGGGALFALGWLAATYGFGWYVANVANYGSTYGALAGVIVVMVWFYLSALILVLVAHLVAMAAHRLAPERIEASRRQRGILENAQEAAADAIGSLAGDHGGARGRPESDEPREHREPERAPAPAMRPASGVPSNRQRVPVALAGAAFGAVVALLASTVANRRNGG